MLPKQRDVIDVACRSRNRGLFGFSEARTLDLSKWSALTIGDIRLLLDLKEIMSHECIP
jgi:hypothetical protein